MGWREAEVAKLLKEVANPNAKDAQGRTALMLASAKGNSEIIKTLISKGVDVNAKDNADWTLLVHAFADMHFTGAEFLISKKTKTNSKNLPEFNQLRLPAFLPYKYRNPLRSSFPTFLLRPSSLSNPAS